MKSVTIFTCLGFVDSLGCLPFQPFETWLFHYRELPYFGATASKALSLRDQGQASPLASKRWHEQGRGRMRPFRPFRPSRNHSGRSKTDSTLQAGRKEVQRVAGLGTCASESAAPPGCCKGTRGLAIHQFGRFVVGLQH